MSIINELTDKFNFAVSDFSLFDGIDRYVLLFSGGKDCTFLLDMILRNYPDIAQNMNVFCVEYPVHVYKSSNGVALDNYSKVRDYWESRGVNIEYCDTNCIDMDDDDILGCRICKKSRKTVIDPYVNKKPVGTGLLTGFTLYDIMAYVNLLLINTNFDLSKFELLPHEQKTQMIKMLHKFIPRENLPNGKIMIRPLLRFNELEIKEYLHALDIPYINTPCKIGKYKFKREYFKALNIYPCMTVTYDGVICMLEKHGISIFQPYDEMVEDNFFIDC